MRRLGLVWLALAAATIALPASARGFRVDGFDCTSSEPFFFCWGENSSVSNARVELPTNGGTIGFTPNTPGYPSPPGPSFNPAVFENLGFTFTAFDWAAFLASTEFATRVSDPSTISAPTVLVTRGFARVTTHQGEFFADTDAPTLRINWFFDSDLETLFPDIFEPTNNGSFGVQMIFYGNGSQHINDAVPDGAGFELNGLRAYQYSYGKDGQGDFLWNGSDEPCDTFANDGSCIGVSGNGVPEPSSVALLGLGFLALVFGLRTGRPARTYLA